MLKRIQRKVLSNWQSGLAVSLVSIPLAVSLAVASQTTPVVGIITAIWAGLIASIFGGSNYNIIGPTGALSGILATFAIAHGAENLAMVAIVSGVFIMIAAFFKLERYLVFVPASSIHGFILGVAVIVSFNQVFSAFGLSNIKPSDNCLINVIESFKHISDASLASFVVFVAFLLGLLLLARFYSKIPPAIVLAPFGVLLGYLSFIKFLPFDLQTLASKYGNISVSLFQMPHLYIRPYILLPALTVAIVSIIETMISARVADGITKTKHNKRKEMMGLGLANIACGAAGGIPATAALARTALNIKTGGKDKMSAAICSVFIALISLILLPYFKYIPMATIAAMLVFVSIKMVEAEHFMRMFKIDKKNFVISLVVAFVTVYEDPIMGIMFGAAAAMLIFMERLSRGQCEFVSSAPVADVGDSLSYQQNKEDWSSPALIYAIKGQLAYINAQAHISRFDGPLDQYPTVILNLKELYFIDFDGIDAFSELIEQIRAQDKKVLIVQPSPLIVQMLMESKVYRELKGKGLVFDSVSSALAAKN